MFSFFDPFFYPQTRVVVVTEEQLREAQRKARLSDIENLEARIKNYREAADHEVANAEKRLEKLRAELAAIAPSKEAENN